MRQARLGALKVRAIGLGCMTMTNAYGVADHLRPGPGGRRLRAKGEHIVPIPGTRRRTWLEENVAAASVELGDDVVTQLDALFAPERVAGARYGQSWMQSKDTA